jgi:hypothetical protein
LVRQPLKLLNNSNFKITALNNKHQKVCTKLRWFVQGNMPFFSTQILHPHPAIILLRRNRLAKAGLHLLVIEAFPEKNRPFGRGGACTAFFGMTALDGLLFLRATARTPG